MNAKKFLKTITIFFGCGAATVFGIKKFLRLKEKIDIETEKKKSDEAFIELLDLNNLLESDGFTYVSDSGLTPIYTYDFNYFAPGIAVIPRGYVMHKLFHASGAINYAYGLEPEKGSSFANYHVLFYLEDKDDWHENLAYKEHSEDLEEI